MDLKVLNGRLTKLTDEIAEIDQEIRHCTIGIQDFINAHADIQSLQTRINSLVPEKQALMGKISIVEEFIEVAKASKTKKKKKE